MINIFVTHYARAESAALNEVTRIAVEEIEHVTTTPHRLTVVGWVDSDALWRELEERLAPFDVRVIRNDRPGRPDIQPSQRNKVIDVARADGDDPFVLLHNDVRPSIGWLERLAGDLRWGESRWGHGSCLVSPLYIPFHGSAWPDLDASRKVLTPAQMTAWCTEQGVRFRRGRAHAHAWQPPLDVGRQLMMFITRPSFFDQVGYCDEAFVGANLDDVEWGMRAIMAGKKNLRSQAALMGHIARLSFNTQGPSSHLNDQAFIAKWGQARLRDVRTSGFWDRLRATQQRVPNRSNPLLHFP